MKYTALRPMLWTDKLEESITFYETVLGFTTAEYNKDWAWASLYKDSVEIMLAEPNQHIPFTKATFTGSFYITVDDVESEWNLLKEKCKIVYPIENFDHGMREFAIYDTNGYIIQFGQEIEPEKTEL